MILSRLLKEYQKGGGRRMDVKTITMIGICIIIGIVYAIICDKKGNTPITKMRYLAIILCMAVAVFSTYLGKLQSVIGSPMIGLFIGMFLVNVIPNLNSEIQTGAKFVGKKYLSLGIVLAGATLNFSEVLAAGKALPLVIFNIFLSFSVAYLIGRKVLKQSSNVCTLVGGGTCICGGTAIATLSSIIKAKEEEIAYAMTAIFLFDVLAALSYPYLAGAIGLNANQFGYLAGTAINDTSSVVAAQVTYGVLNELPDFNLAVTVKLVRTTMLIAIAVVFTILTIRQEAQAANKAGNTTSVGQTVLKVFPWFILIFLGMALLNTANVFGKIPMSADFFKSGYKFFVTVALVGVGFKIKFKDLFTKGVKPIILGGCTWLAVAASSMIFVYVFANYIG